VCAARRQEVVTPQDKDFDITTQLSALLHINETPVEELPPEINTKAIMQRPTPCPQRRPPRCLALWRNTCLQ
jgi:hypothetical protein